MTTVATSFRAAFSLMEVMIAMVIFSIAMVALIQALTGMRSTVAVGSAQDSLNEDAGRIFIAMRDDLITSGWYFPDSTVTTAGVDQATDRTLLYYPYVQIQGTATAAAFVHHVRTASTSGPSIPSWASTTLEKTRAGLAADAGTSFTSASVITAQYGGDPAKARAAYLRSFFARSQELIFLRSTNGSWDASSDLVSLGRRNSAVVRFKDVPRSVWRDYDATHNVPESLGILRASGWRLDLDNAGNINGYIPNLTKPWVTGSTETSATKPYGVVMESGLMEDPNDPSLISPNWETLDSTGYTTANVANLKEFSYCVIPSRYGFGRLVRGVRVAQADTRPQFNPAGNVWGERGVVISRNGADGVMVDEVLSDDVVRIAFDTYRTVDSGASAVTSMDINQIKIRVYMARPSVQNRDVIIRRMFETVVCMRSMNSAYEKDFSSGDANSNSTRLGTAPIGIAY